MLSKHILSKKRNLRKILSENGVIIKDYSRKSKDIENLIKTFMESIDKNPEDFPEILKQLEITLPVTLYTFAYCKNRVKFCEENGKQGNIELISAYKNQVENYEVPPCIHIYSEYSTTFSSDTYAIENGICIKQ